MALLLWLAQLEERLTTEVRTTQRRREPAPIVALPARSPAHAEASSPAPASSGTSLGEVPEPQPVTVAAAS